MRSLKQIKLADKVAAQQQHVISELNSFVGDIVRCEKNINDLKNELEAVNLKHKSQSTTRENIEYLEDLLKCAKKKLNWEKNMASLQKRTPLLLEKISAVINDQVAPPSDELRGQIAQSLSAVQAAMERLQNVKVI